MKSIKLYRFNGEYMTEPYGAYIMDPHPDILAEADEILTVDGVFVPINDGAMANCLVVQKGGKIGLLYADGYYQNEYTYKSSGRLFRYDKLRIYGNMNLADETAYAVALESGCWKVLELDTTKEGPKETVIQEFKELDNGIYGSPVGCIPQSHLYGFGYAPFEYTPDIIRTLQDDEVFVFGSNKEGRHGGGAARVAAERFGAQYGVGVGMTGHCYAIPTMDGSLDLIREYVEGFRCYAFCHPELTFYVTRIGCGIAGWKDEQIAPLFDFGFMHTLANVILPRGWDSIPQTMDFDD